MLVRYCCCVLPVRGWWRRQVEVFVLDGGLHGALPPARVPLIIRWGGVNVAVWSVLLDWRGLLLASARAQRCNMVRRIVVGILHVRRRMRGRVALFWLVAVLCWDDWSRV